MEKTKRVIGAIVGDIVGSIYEFNNHRSKEFSIFGRGCFATDDSIMTLAVAKALMDSGGGKPSTLSAAAVKAMQEVGRPYPNCGYGGRFMNWMYDDDPRPYNSFGNGAAMRISPVAYVAGDLQEVKRLSEQVTAVTHNHPEGIKGAEATAVATWMALHDYAKEEIIAEMGKYYDLDFTLDEIRPTYRFNETCQNTVPQAIVCFNEGMGFEDTLRNAVSIGGDSDTLAAIACAIAGAFYGVPKDIEMTARTYLDERLTKILDGFIDYCD